MRALAARITNTLSDLTIGTVIVLVHVAIADREASRRSRVLDGATVDGRRFWRTQISP